MAVLARGCGRPASPGWLTKQELKRRPGLQLLHLQASETNLLNQTVHFAVWDFLAIVAGSTIWASALLVALR